MTTETETLPVKPPTSNDQTLHALCKRCDKGGRHQAICGAGNAGKERFEFNEVPAARVMCVVCDEMWKLPCAVCGS